MAARDDEPEHLRAQRGPFVELDHTNVQFADIVRRFREQHGPVELGERSDGVPVLPQSAALRFQRLHRELTNDWADVKAIDRDEHTRVTQQRRLA